MPRIIIEIPETRTEEFHQFLKAHQEVDSFQKLENCFLINLICQEEGYSAFLEVLKGIFLSFHLKELCQAKCRDGTDCLNTIQEGKYCWKHQSKISSHSF